MRSRIVLIGGLSSVGQAGKRLNLGARGTGIDGCPCQRNAFRQGSHLVGNDQRRSGVQKDRIPVGPRRPVQKRAESRRVLGRCPAHDRLERVRLQVGSPKTADPAAIAASFESAVSTMEGKGWKRILRVVDEEERVLLFAREDGGTIAGLTLLVSDGGEELVLVNVVGAIDPVLLGRVIAKADQLPQLESYLSAGQ